MTNSLTPKQSVEPAYLPNSAKQRPYSRHRATALPFLLRLVILGIFVAWLFGNRVVAGFNVTGWCWLIPLAVSVLSFLVSRRRNFPLRYWMPWILVLVVGYSTRQQYPDATQSTAQMLTPFFVGMAASSLHMDEARIARVLTWIASLAIVAWIIIGIKLPMILSGILPTRGAMTPEAITCTMFAAIYISLYACGNTSALWRYIAVLAVPAILLTRGPLLAALATAPLTMSPLPTKRRAILTSLLIVAALALFFTPRMQRVMFRSGSGKVSDLSASNQDLDLSGRRALWQAVWDGWKERPWIGHGPNSSRTVLTSKVSRELYLPHNDWLRCLHDFGVIGVLCYAFGIIAQIWALIRMAPHLETPSRSLAYAAASAFIPYCIVMFTDNVTLYVQYYGNFHFALIGVVYAAASRSRYRLPITMPDQRLSDNHCPV